MLSLSLAEHSRVSSEDFSIDSNLFRRLHEHCLSPSDDLTTFRISCEELRAIFTSNLFPVQFLARIHSTLGRSLAIIADSFLDISKVSVTKSVISHLTVNILANSQASVNPMQTHQKYDYRLPGVVMSLHAEA